MIQFYKDDITRFEASVNIQGSTGTERIARLVLEVGGTKLMFDGVFKNNRVVVEIPKLMDISETTGEATLEVIADRTYFVPWKSDVELITKKSVEVDEVSIARAEPVSVVVDDINLEQREDEVDEDPFLPDCSTRNRMTALSFIEKHDDNEELLEDFPEAVRTWAIAVFRNIDSDVAKIAMTELSNKINN